MVEPTNNPEHQPLEIQGLRANFWIRLGVLVAFLVPVGYAGTLLAVAVHEVVGHGFTAWCLGGEFVGFQLNWDAMGWAAASASLGAPQWHHVMILCGGALSTTVVGSLFLLIAALLKDRLFLRLTLLLLSACFVLDGSIYMFWSSYHAQPPGDMARIIEMTQSNVWRATFLVLGLLLTISFTVIPLNLLIQVSSRWLSPREALVGIRRAVMPVLFGAGYAAGMVAFDWNQLVHGIGDLPKIVGVIMGFLTGVFLYCRPLPLGDGTVEFGQAKWPLAYAWGTTMVLVVIMWGWLTDGVYWGR
jgi:hypothetical protein